MKAKSKLLLSGAALAASIAVATTSTFAWFTTSSTTTVGGLDFNAEGGAGLEISVDGENWYSSLPQSVITNAVGSVLFKPTTSTDGKEIKAEAGEAASAGSYASLSLYFRTDDAAAKEVYLNTGTTCASTAGSATYTIHAWNAVAKSTYKTGAEGNFTVGETITAELVNAARISFTDNAASSTKVWEPGKGQGWDLGNLANDYRNHVNGTETSVGTTVSTLSTTDLNLGANNAAAVVSIPVSTDRTSLLAAYKLDIKIWIEGWDGDCFNSIMAQELKTSLCFGIRNASAG